ncbi:MAG TPA: endo-1,4-beta-xylanase [Actinophytocola sp.]|uniref:endo-1,4-beta-xylanase n=1 Tax=Actinophytocola sp. TaxID=1872138 RepID=UPI002DBB8A29|nr:endo-1,4-beta-xylanase [Actinophytocola sp.]HEU5472260.1 endo-1,4-beta-xylanase [Actinophytocola sp.]
MKLTSIAAVTVLAASILYSVSLTSSADDAGTQRHTVPVDSPLRDLAKRQDLLIGTAVDYDAFNADTVYRERIATEFSSITAENVMKWQLLEPERGKLDFTAADELIAAAKRSGQKVRGHTLLWHNQLPTWLTEGVASGEISPAELRNILRKHVIDVASHFRGKLYQWDVVNEVIDDDANLRDTIFLQNLGPGYIADVFRWARQADPKVKLYLNDYNVEGLNAKSDAYFQLVKDLLRQRVPVDGFGAQGHYGVQFGFHSASEVMTNLRRFEDLGLETSITEVDVRMIMPPDTVKLQAQAQGYSVLLQGCLLARKCTSFTVWGYTDKYSWVPGFFTGEGAANLLDENFAAKPGYRELQAVLALAGR